MLRRVDPAVGFRPSSKQVSRVGIGRITHWGCSGESGSHEVIRHREIWIHSTVVCFQIIACKNNDRLLSPLIVFQFAFSWSFLFSLSYHDRTVYSNSFFHSVLFWIYFMLQISSLLNWINLHFLQLFTCCGKNQGVVISSRRSSCCINIISRSTRRTVQVRPSTIVRMSISPINRALWDRRVECRTAVGWCRGRSVRQQRAALLGSGWEEIVARVEETSTGRVTGQGGDFVGSVVAIGWWIVVTDDSSVPKWKVFRWNGLPSTWWRVLEVSGGVHAVDVGIASGRGRGSAFFESFGFGAGRYFMVE